MVGWLALAQRRGMVFTCQESDEQPIDECEEGNPQRK